MSRGIRNIFSAITTNISSFRLKTQPASWIFPWSESPRIFPCCSQQALDNPREGRGDGEPLGVEPWSWVSSASGIQRLASILVRVRHACACAPVRGIESNETVSQEAQKLTQDPRLFAPLHIAYEIRIPEAAHLTQSFIGTFAAQSCKSRDLAIRILRAESEFLGGTSCHYYRRWREISYADNIRSGGSRGDEGLARMLNISILPRDWRFGLITTLGIAPTLLCLYFVYNFIVLQYIVLSEVYDIFCMYCYFLQIYFDVMTIHFHPKAVLNECLQTKFVILTHLNR